jgi:hypothetical protein
MRRGTHKVSRPYIRSVPICIDIAMLRCQQPRITGYRLNQKELEEVTLQPGVLISALFEPRELLRSAAAPPSLRDQLLQTPTKTQLKRFLPKDHPGITTSPSDRRSLRPA